MIFQRCSATSEPKQIPSQVGWLGFNSIFSTNQLYHARAEVKILLKKFILERYLNICRLGVLIKMCESWQVTIIFFSIVFNCQRVSTLINIFSTTASRLHSITAPGQYCLVTYRQQGGCFTLNYFSVMCKRKPDVQPLYQHAIRDT